MRFATITVACLAVAGDARRTQVGLIPPAAFQGRVASAAALPTRARNSQTTMQELIFENFQKSQTRSDDSEFTPISGYTLHSRSNTEKANEVIGKVVSTKPKPKVIGKEVFDNYQTNLYSFQQGKRRSEDPDSEFTPLYPGKNYPDLKSKLNFIQTSGKVVSTKRVSGPTSAQATEASPAEAKVAGDDVQAVEATLELVNKYKMASERLTSALANMKSIKAEMDPLLVALEKSGRA